MRRGEFYRIAGPGGGDPRRHRVYLVVSRQELIDSSHGTVVCVPVFSLYGGLETQVPVGPAEGLKADSSLHCDGLASFQKARLRDFLGTLPPARWPEVERAMQVALGIL